jgi:citrate lyase subunit beta/citryl-CoA lyase
MTTWTSPGPAYLFCPADRPDRFAKAAAVADAVIVDLEDAVAPDRREAARENILSADLDPSTTIVRVNPLASPDHARDMAMLRDSHIHTVMLAKTSSAEEVSSLEHFNVIALCETPAGISAVEEIAECSNVVGVMWGAEDLVAALGGYSSRHGDGTYRDVARYARVRTLIAARTHLLVALDAVSLNFEDLDGQRAEASDAAAMGFSATACVHPSQVSVLREAYRPTPAQIAWAQRVLEGDTDGGEGASGAQGVYRVDGLMVDGPVLAQAREILGRAQRS